MLAADLNKLIENLASAFRGEVTLRVGPISPFPEMKFYHQRGDVFVDLVTREGAERVTVTVPGKPRSEQRQFDVRLYLPRRFDAVLDWIGHKDKRAKELDQEGAFRLHTANAGRLARYFRENAAYRLREMSWLPSSGELAVASTPGRFLLQKPVVAFELDAIKHIVTMTLRLFDCIQDGAVIPFGETAAEQKLETVKAANVRWDPVLGACRVCGDAFEGKVLCCGQCSTPHHPDCWEYTGGCSVYACGGKQAA